LLAVGLSFVALALGRFTIRDSKRTPPAKYDFTVARADGQSKYIKPIQWGAIPYAEKDGRRIPVL